MVSLECHNSHIPMDLIRGKKVSGVPITRLS